MALENGLYAQVIMIRIRELVDTRNNFYCRLTEACHVLYNVKSDDKCENELKDWGWDDYHLFPAQEY